ncbi:hypothetical protein BD324DRAFT_648163 [Kockovaella imperatae]|uniref:BHLH domain-containing protein n=1 Tax=Kockovaella imperatae TaxID=4999 RepID=A0A1Y1UTD5_9TREE|nr:hypothetical protein BD324DRAFT_648163 [Kockovaella imperatae]ORX41289.1 hypothetical protein BD324DRAFT_648163 [Kockovaella imperatae]
MSAQSDASRSVKRRRMDDGEDELSPSPRSGSPRLATPEPYIASTSPPDAEHAQDVQIYSTSSTEAAPSALPSWSEWQGPSSLASMLLHPDSNPSQKSGKGPNVPIAPQPPIIAFPFNFGYSATAPKDSTTQNPNLAAIGVDRGTSGGLAIDPTLSSLRSGAQGGNPLSEHNSPLPDIEITEDTLQSASDQNSAALQAALEQARAEAAAMDMDGGNGMDHSGSTGPGSVVGSNGGLAPPDDGTPRKEQPFSRSPELKITHKLAERKRRKEMKDLFDELSEMLPVERGSKSSKWEILSRAIDHIRSVKRHNDELVAENQKLRRELEITRGNGGQGGTNTTFSTTGQNFNYNLASYASDANVTGSADDGATVDPALNPALNGKTE